MARRLLLLVILLLGSWLSSRPYTACAAESDLKLPSWVEPGRYEFQCKDGTVVTLFKDDHSDPLVDPMALPLKELSAEAVAELQKQEDIQGWVNSPTPYKQLAPLPNKITGMSSPKLGPASWVGDKIFTGAANVGKATKKGAKKLKETAGPITRGGLKIIVPTAVGAGALYLGSQAIRNNSNSGSVNSPYGESFFVMYNMESQIFHHPSCYSAQISTKCIRISRPEALRLGRACMNCGGGLK